MKRLVIAILGPVMLLAVDVLAATVPVLPFEDVQPGMKGIGRTVFEGTRVESFEVEILAKLRNVAPDRNLILGRCSGGPLERTRILAGMSGSPVTVDGKLIGAVAYSWGYSTEPIAGITPIEEMLAITDLAAGAPRRSSAAAWDGGNLAPLQRPATLRVFFDEQLASMTPRVNPGLPAHLPVAVSGLGDGELARLMPELAKMGFVPVQGGFAGDSPKASPPLEPGSAIGIKLVRGDLQIAATGTVTWVDGDRVLAFGHPMFDLGDVDFPMTGAEVQALMPNLRQSARIATPLSEIGALRQDRSSGVLGLVGADPDMIPVRVQVTSSHGNQHSFAYDIVGDAKLAPVLLFLSLRSILAGAESQGGDGTIRLRDGSGIKLAGGEEIRLDNLFTGSQITDYGSGIPAYVLFLLMNNTWSPPRVAGINLIAEYDEVPRAARITRVSLDRSRVRPGETLHAAIRVSPYRGRDEILTREIMVPHGTPAGSLALRIAGAEALNESEEFEEPTLPSNLSQLVQLINQLRRNDRVYIAATREDSGVLLDGTRLPNLPPSVARILSKPRSQGNFAVLPRRRVLEETLKAGYRIQGSATVRVEVLEP